MLRLLAVFCLIVIGICACQKEKTPDENLIARDALQTEQGHNVEMLYSDSAQVKVKINAPLLLRYTDRNAPRQVFPEGVKIIFFDPNKQIQSQLTGRYAVRYETQGRTIIRDSVRWNSVQLERLETTELIWDEKQNIVYSDKFVKITKPGEVIYGWGFRTNQSFTNWRINAIEGRFKADGFSQGLE